MAAGGWFKGRGEDDVDELNTAINEQSGEERRLAARFQKAMNEFATERSLETCLDALNLSIQLANGLPLGSGEASTYAFQNFIHGCIEMTLDHFYKDLSLSSCEIFKRIGKIFFGIFLKLLGISA